MAVPIVPSSPLTPLEGKSAPDATLLPVPTPGKETNTEKTGDCPRGLQLGTAAISQSKPESCPARQGPSGHTTLVVIE